MERSIATRGFMAAAGGLAGLGLHGLSETLEAGLLPAMPALGLAALLTGFAVALLAMWGPLPGGRAAGRAALVAVAASTLVMLAALRFDAPGAVMSDGFAMLAFFVTVLVPLPFLIAGGTGDYPALFAQAWGIAVRYASAWLFVGAVFLLLLLSDMLLGIVGIDAIGDALEVEAVRWAVAGLALGLGMAVASELSDYVSPQMVLRLLRLLLPVVLVVMAVFIAALPFRGLSGLLGTLSVAAVLLSMCLAAATLVTVAIDRRDEDAVRLPLMAASARALAVILPVPAVLALWSVWLRVGEYGWTPSRLFAALAAGVAVAYGAVYLLAVLRGRGWQGRIRRGNVWLALLLIGLAALWQTPLLDANAISARSQLARIEAGRMDELAPFGDWGRAGAAAQVRLADLAAQPGNEALARQLRLVRNGGAGVSAADLAAVLPVRPEGQAAMRDRVVAAMTPRDRDAVLRACAAGPHCVMVVGAFHPGAGDEAMVLWGRDWLDTRAYAEDGGRIVERSVVTLGPDLPDPRATIRSLLDGPIRLTPVARNQMEIPGGGMIIGR